MILESKVSSRSRTTANASTVQLKEEMFSDLSGLIIRDVKVETGVTSGGSFAEVKPTDSNGSRIVYDCLQTGRNGGMILCSLLNRK
jgi:hypothetical protein